MIAIVVLDPQGIDIQPRIQRADGVATLVFDIQVPTLESAFILIR